MSADLPLHFGLLGPVQAQLGEQGINLGGPRHRTLLAMLLLSVDCVVSVDTLIEGLWNGRPPSTGRGQVAICIGALRKSLRAAGCGHDVIQTVHPGYRLSSTHVTLDLTQNAELANRARAQLSADRLDLADDLFDQALGLWRGSALAGVDSDLVRAEAAELDEQRLTMVEEHLTLKLQLGKHRTLIRHLASLVRQYPLRERSRANLMLAQYRSGRRAEALDTFADGRRLLIDEIGLEPGAELQALQAAILHEDPSLLMPGTVDLLPGTSDAVTAPSFTDRPAQLPGVPAELIERHSALTELDALLTVTAAGRRRIGVITGAPGSGKTAMAAFWAHRHLKAFPDGQLFADLGEGDQIQHPSLVLERFLRALRVPPERIPAALSDRTSLYRNVVEDRRLVIVLDNAHSFRQVEPLLPPAGACTALITTRQPITGLYGDPPVATVKLAELSRSGAVDLLSAVAGRQRVQPDDPYSHRLADLCGRSPLALRVAAGRLLAKPHWAPADLVRRLEDPHRRLDELTDGDLGVRTSFRASGRDLRPDEAALFRYLGMLGTPRFTDWLGAALIDTSLVRADQIMERLVDLQLLEVAAVDSAGRASYRFRELVGLYAREQAASSSDQTALREAIDRAHGAVLALAEHAHRLLYQGDFARLSGPAHRWLLPESQADDLLSDPQAWFEREQHTIKAVVQQATRQQQVGLAWQLAMLLAVSGAASTTALECCSLARQAAEQADDRRGVAAMCYSAALLDAPQSTLQLGHALAEVTELGDRHARGLILGCLAAQQMAEEPAEARRRFADALVELRATGDRYAEAVTMARLAGLERSTGSRQLSARFAEESQSILAGLNIDQLRGVGYGHEPTHLMLAPRPAGTSRRKLPPLGQPS